MVHIGKTSFDRVDYDADGDVLYLHRADPAEAVDFDESPEGHHLRFDGHGQLIGMTIVRPQWLLAHQGEITISIPERIHLGPDALVDVLVASTTADASAGDTTRR